MLLIDDFNISDECYKRLKRAAFTYVEEVVEFLTDNDYTIMLFQPWLLCFDEMAVQFKLLGLWSETIEQNWPHFDDDKKD